MPLLGDYFPDKFFSASAETKSDPPSGTPRFRDRFKPTDRIETTYAFIYAFLPDEFIGFESESGWLLPGGIVDGVGRPAELPPRSDVYHTAPLSWYVKQQTGLTLAGVSDLQSISVRAMPTGPEVTLLYCAEAFGTLVAGVRLNSSALPSFAYVTGDPTALIQRTARQAHDGKPLRMAPARGGLTGVYITSTPTKTPTEGPPCYLLLRFYADGTILHTGLCTESVLASWPDIRRWFHPLNPGLGHGIFRREGQRVTFALDLATHPGQPPVTLDGAGELQGEQLTLDLGYRFLQQGERREFVRVPVPDA